MKLLRLLCGVWLLGIGALAQTITNQPQNITINTASTALFTVGASGVTNYQWFFNGAPLSDNPNITGSTTSTLLLEDVMAEQAGTYRVTLNGSTNSSDAVLTVLPGTIVRFTFTNFPDGTSSNVDVELFNHDKPVTVQNFLHYISAGAYTNMFFDRCVQGFILQGGDYGTSNRTDTVPPATGWDISTQFVQNLNLPLPFPAGIINEFNVGPLVHNRFGTIAMARVNGSPNSATSAFFFNLNDNSANLDFQNSGFTVFGRILGGTNVLQYFNTLTNGDGFVTNGLLLDGSFGNSSVFMTNIPVNYIGTNPPANANLVYCDFVVTNPPGATNLPDLTITSPVSGVLVSNSGFTVQGTATDNNNIGLAFIRCDLVPVAGGAAITKYGLGASNWSVNFGSVPSGSYNLTATAQDEAGNVSPPVTIAISVSLAPLQLTVIGPGTVSPFTNGQLLPTGTNFQITATPDSGGLFYTWSNGAAISVNPAQTFTMTAGLHLTVIFVTNNFPGLITFTSPPSNGVVAPGNVSFAGALATNAALPVNVSVQLFSKTNSLAVSQVLTTLGIFNWSTGLAGLGEGAYTLVAIGTDGNGGSTLISEDFTISTNVPLRLNIVGPGTVSPVTNGQFFDIGSTFQATATPNAGQLFYAWSSNGTAYSLNPVQAYTMTSGLTLTAVFVTNNLPGLISITNPGPNGIVGSNNVFFGGGIGTNARSEPVTISAEIFSRTNSFYISQLLQTNGVTGWSFGLQSLPLGPYTILVQGTDGAGDSALASQDFTVQYAANLQVIVAGNGTVSPVTNGQSFPIGTNFTVTATPGSGEVFYTWDNGSQSFTNATQGFTMESGLTITATFIPSNTAKGITITYPPPNARVTTNSFQIKGRVNPKFKPADIACQIFQTNGLAVGPQLKTTGTTTWSVNVKNLVGGNYIVEATATNDDGLSTIVSQKFSVLPFSAVAGTYSGLFICSNSPVSSTNSGYLTFTVSPAGLMTGKLALSAYPPIPIYNYPFLNVGFEFGYFHFDFTNFHGSPLHGDVYLDQSIGNDAAAGAIYSDTWSSLLICRRAVKALSSDSVPAPGKYALSLQMNGSTTNGYASMNVSKNGTLAVVGALPDDTTFSYGAKVSREGVWPLYAVPNGDKNRGVLLGWETNKASGAASGQLYWYKAAQTGSYYTAGVGVVSNMVVNSSGTNFIKPVSGGAYSIVFAGGSFAAPLTNSLSVNSAGQFTVSGGTADKLKISLSAAGVIAGSLQNPADNKTLHFKGIFLSAGQGGSGFIPEADGETGFFKVTAIP